MSQVQILSPQPDKALENMMFSGAFLLSTVNPGKLFGDVMDVYARHDSEMLDVQAFHRIAPRSKMYFTRELRE